jgi:predicted HTH transcriptional regulator
VHKNIFLCFRQKNLISLVLLCNRKTVYKLLTYILCIFSFNQFFNLEFSRIDGGHKGGHKGGIIITKRQLEVLNLIKDNPRIEQQELVEILGINRSAVQKHINSLKDSNIIIRKDGKKHGYWEIIAEVE